MYKKMIFGLGIIVVVFLTLFIFNKEDDSFVINSLSSVSFMQGSVELNEQREIEESARIRIEEDKGVEKVIMKTSQGEFTIECKTSSLGDEVFDRSPNSYVSSYEDGRWKYGFYSGKIGFNKHQCQIKSRSPIELIGNNYYVRDGNGGFKYDDSDVCPGFNNVTNESIPCRYKLSQVYKEVIDPEFNESYNTTDYWMLETVGWTWDFYDPSWTYENLESESTLDRVRFEGDGSSHLVVNDTSIILYFPFDPNISQSTIFDYSNNNNDGTVNGNAIFTNEGLYNGAFTFSSGNTDYIEADVQLVSGYPFTLSAWVLPQTAISQGTIISLVDLSLVGKQHSIKTDSTGTNATIFARDGATSTNGWSNKTLTLGSWHLVTGVYATATDRKLYVDGVLSAVSTTSVAYDSGVDRWSVGRSGDSSPGEYYNGSMDDVMVLDVALSQAQVLDLYNNQSSRFFTLGVQEFLDQNITLGSDNTLNVTNATFLNNQSSNITMRIGGWRSDYAYTNNFTDGLSRDLYLMLGLNNNSLFGENDSLAFDYSTGQRNGTINGNPTLNSGRYGNDYFFDGSGDFIDIGDKIDMGTGNMSLSVWVKLDKAVKNGNYNVIEKRGFTPDIQEGYRIIYRGVDGTIRLQIRGSFVINIDATTNISDGKYHHVMGTFDRGGNGVIYIDGVAETTSAITSVSGEDLNTNVNLLIGGNSPNNANFEFNGSLDEVAIWKRHLNSSEVTEMYVKSLAIRNYTEPQLITGQNNFTVNNNETNFIAEVSYNTPGFYSTTLLTGGFNVDSFFQAVGPPADNPPVVTLNTSDSLTFTVDTFNLNCSATDDQGLTNLSIYHNLSGSFVINQTSVIPNQTYNFSQFEFSGVADGFYVWNCEAFDNSSQSAFASANKTFTVSTTPPTDNTFPSFTNFIEDPTDPATYVKSSTYTFNATIENTNGTAFGTFNGTVFPATNSTSNYTFSVSDLSVGVYNYNWTAFGNGSDNNLNSSATFTYTINRASAETSLTFDFSSPQTFPQTIIPSCDVISGEISAVLTLNGSVISNGSSQILSAGDHLFNCSIAQSQNFTSAQNNSIFTIDRNTSSCTITSNSPVTYPADVQVNASCTNPENGETLFRDDVDVTSENGSFVDLGVASYSYKVNVSLSQNYTTATANITVQVLIGTQTLNLIFSPSNSIFNGTTSTVTGSGDNVTSILYRNFTNVTNPDVANLSVGVYNYTYNNTGNINWSAASVSGILNVSEAPPVVIVLAKGWRWLNGSDFIVASLETDGDFNISGELFVVGNASVFDLDIRNPGSLTFEFGKYKLSAEDFVFGVMTLMTNVTPSGVRRQIVADSDFQIRHNLSGGTAFLSVFNPHNSPLSKVSIAGVNSDNTGFAITKSNSLFSENNVMEFNNNGGDMDFIQGPLITNVNQPILGGVMRFGFYDNFTLNINLSILSFNNKQFLMILNHTKGVTINANLEVTDNLTVGQTIFGNEVYGSIAFYDPNNGNTTFSGIGLYTNVHGFQPQFFNQVTHVNGTYLTALHSGIYEVSASTTLASQSGLYSFALGKNDVESNLTFQIERIQSTSTKKWMVQGRFNLSVGDNISLMVADLNNPLKEIDVLRADLYMKRIGDN